MPSSLQFFARDSQDSAEVLVAGSVAATSLDSFSVRLLKNGVLYKRVVQPLVYNNGKAPFSLSVKVHAELSNYTIEVFTGTTLAASADNLVCGDAFMVDGQSNATWEVTRIPATPWIRTFESSGWSIPQSRAWGIDFHIIDEQQIPVCVINGAVGGTSIDSHLPGGIIYQDIYNRITGAGLKNGIKAVLWHQGEGNTGDDGTIYAHTGYTDKFKTLYDRWNADYPGIQHFYVFQIHHSADYCGGDWGGFLRDVQRRMPEQFANLSVMSTVGVAGHDGCHYDRIGYYQMGDWMYRLIARDIYHSTDIVNINAPNIKKAFFPGGDRTRLTLLFDQPVLWPADYEGHSMKDFFFPGNDIIGKAVDSQTTDTAQYSITLFFKSPLTANTITYSPNQLYPGTNLCYEGPWLLNKRGIGALTFYKFPIDSSILPNIITINITADNVYDLFVNGRLVGSNNSWQNVESYSADIQPGKNVIAVKAVDLGAPGGLLVDITGTTNRYGTSVDWKTSTQEQVEWNTTSFDDASWAPATMIGAYGIEPWGYLSGIPAGTTAQWIWGTEGTVYFRYVIDVPSTVNEPAGLTLENLALTASPNPFNPSARISYCLAQKAAVSLTLYNPQGKIVRKLVSGMESAGMHTVQVDADGLASGIYICEFKCNTTAKRLKLILMR